MKRVISILFLGVLYIHLNGQSKILDIQPVRQNTAVWCWVSVGEMIFRYYNVCCINPGGNFQCGIIALLGPACNFDCRNCQVPAMHSQVLQNMLLEYPRVAQSICGYGKNYISSTLINSRISQGQIIAEIDSDRPIITGISPGGIRGSEPQHVALIIGYTVSQGDLVIFVNDPFPFDLLSAYQNPYIMLGGQLINSGTYKISYSNFVQLNWTKSFINIQ